MYANIRLEYSFLRKKKNFLKNSKDKKTAFDKNNLSICNNISRNLFKNTFII